MAEAEISESKPFPIDVQVLSILDHLRIFRNEAVHYHNQDPADAISALKKFLEFLKWYDHLQLGLIEEE
jgi:hypothetical protein